MLFRSRVTEVRGYEGGMRLAPRLGVRQYREECSDRSTRGANSECGDRCQGTSALVLIHSKRSAALDAEGVLEIVAFKGREVSGVGLLELAAARPFTQLGRQVDEAHAATHAHTRLLAPLQEGIVRVALLVSDGFDRALGPRAVAQRGRRRRQRRSHSRRRRRRRRRRCRASGWCARVVAQPLAVLRDARVHAGVAFARTAVAPRHHSDLPNRVPRQHIRAEQRSPRVALARVLGPLVEAGAQHAVGDRPAVFLIAIGIGEDGHGHFHWHIRQRASLGGGAPASHGEHPRRVVESLVQRGQRVEKIDRQVLRRRVELEQRDVVLVGVRVVVRVVHRAHHIERLHARVAIRAAPRLHANLHAAHVALRAVRRGEDPPPADERAAAEVRAIRRLQRDEEGELPR
mmetsp:Transcript_16130/g.40601  ORF Transcript_16130/g.40601 Transcript_16130/m.40601 type:complete len:402 (+) Transcript_16130:44-1249(+)